MELKIVVLALIVISVLFVAGFAGCASRETTETQAEGLDTELQELESMSEDIESLDLELNETELDELEGLF